MGAQNLKAALRRTVTQRRFIFYEGPLLVAGGMTLDAAAGTKARARSILSHLLVDARMPIQDIEGLQEVFEEYAEELSGRPAQGALNARNIDPVLAVSLQRIDRQAGSVSNEGGLNFSDSAFESMIRLGDVSVKDCGEIIDDIREFLTFY
jgi:hypothetical protein